MRKLAVYTLLAYLLGLILAIGWVSLWPERGGIVGTLRIFLPLAGLPLPVALLAAIRTPALRIPWLAATGAMLAFCPPAIGQPRPGEGLTVATWNADGARSLELPDADVLALQEVSLEAHAYPYGWYRTADGVPPAMAILSKRPITDRGVLDGDRELWDIPRVMWVELDNGLTVINAHPIPPYESAVRFNPRYRDPQLEALRSDLIQPLLDSRKPFVLLGDLNAVEREPAYKKLTRDLRDAFRETRFGWQTTWGPRGKSFGLLRLDYILTSPQVTPLEQERLPARPGADHVPVWAKLSL